MIRDLTKSALSLSWACTLLGARQTLNMLQPGAQGRTNVFGPVAQAAADQLDDSMKGIYRSGNNFQSAMVDIAWSSLNPLNWFNPGSWGRMWRVAASQSNGGNWNQSNGGNWTQSDVGNWTKPAANAAQSSQYRGQPAETEQQGYTGSATSNTTSSSSSYDTTMSSGWGPPMSGSQ